MQPSGWRRVRNSFHRWSPSRGEAAECPDCPSAAAAAAAGSAATAAAVVPRPPPHNCFRLVVLGSSKVGKTAIVTRFLTNRFDDNYTPTIEDFHRKLYRIHGQVYQLDILDTSGNHPFPAMRRLSFLTGDLFMLVYSIENRASFDEVRRLREQIVETKCCASAIAARPSAANPRTPLVIVGNKCDKDTDRVISVEEASVVASALPSCGFVETSAKRNLRIDEVFCQLFVLGNLPLEMSPSLHKRVPFLCPSRRGLSLRRRLSDAYGTVASDARRPSIRTDLRILQSKTGVDVQTRERRRGHLICLLQ